jgi:hypothetical protein
MIDTRWMITSVLVIVVLYWAIVNAFQNPLALFVLIIAGFLLFIFVQFLSSEGAKQEKTRQDQDIYRRQIQYFKDHTEICLFHKVNVNKVQKAVFGIVDPKEQDELARSIIDHLRYELPNCERLNSLQAGAEDIWTTCFQITDSQLEPDVCKSKAEKMFKKIIEARHGT